MTTDHFQLGDRFKDTLLEVLRQSDRREAMREAAVGQALKVWTGLLTAAVAEAFGSLGWTVAAKGHKCGQLPKAGQEYLGLDLMAFDPAAAPDGARWHWPVAVAELENSLANDRLAYSLWKVLNISVPLRVVVGYRRDREAVSGLPGLLAESVLRSMPLARWSTLEGEVLLVIGSRSDGEHFPWGYFRFWRLDRGIGRFAPAA